MKRLLTSAFIICLFVGQSANSQPVIVRGGEHTDFTRLVMQIPKDSQWELSGSNGRYTISLDAFEDGFDTSQTFAVIPQTRLVAVRDTNAQLLLELSCDCPIDAFLEQDEYLVIDIKNGPNLKENTPLGFVNEVATSAPKKPTASQFSFGELLWKKPNSEQKESNNLNNMDLSGDARETQAPQELSPNQTELVDATLETLLLGVGEALSRGILEPKSTATDTISDVSENNDNAEIFDSSDPQEPPKITRLGNIRVTNSNDTPNTGEFSSFLTQQNTCPNSDQVSVSTWGSETEIYPQLTAFRAELFTETGNLNRETAIDLVKLYIFMGFGAEAIEALELHNSLSTEYPELFDLADILEHGYSANPRFVHQYAHCDGPLALWAAMAARDLPSNGDLNISAALRELVSLPSHLKRIIAPQLSARLRQVEESEAAAQAIRSIENIGDELVPEAMLPIAMLANELPFTESANQILKEVISNNDQDSPEAVIELVNRKIASNNPVSKELYALLEAFSYENKKGDIAEELEVTLILAASSMGNFDRAFNLLDDRAMQNGSNHRQVVDDVFSDLLDTGSEVQFLQYVFVDGGRWLENLSQKPLQSTASRLLDVGFSDMAKEILLRDSVVEKNETSRLLLAKAEIELGAFENALDILDGIESTEAALIRALAYSNQGDHTSAYLQYSEAQSPEDAAREGWLSNDWVDLTEPDDPVLGSVHSLKSGPSDYVATDNEMLETTEAALISSASAREIMNQLLSTLPTVE